MEVHLNTVLVSAKGGTIDIVSAEGEWLASVGVPAGRVQARDYFDLLPLGAHFEVSEGLAAIQPRSAAVVTGYGRKAVQTDANPDFQPTQVSELERHMRATLTHMQQVSTRMERREAASQNVAERRAEFEAATEQAAKEQAALQAAKVAAQDAETAVVL